MSSQPLVLNVILDWDDFLVHQDSQEKWKEDSSRDHEFIRSQLTKILKEVDKTIDSVEMMMQEGNTSNLYFETETVIRFKVIIEFKGETYNAKKLLKKLVSRSELRGVYFSLDSSCEESLFSRKAGSLKGTVYQQTELKSFKLGTMVGVGNFVSFFDSAKVNPMQLQFMDMECKFRNDLASLHVLFYDPLPRMQQYYDYNNNVTGFMRGNQYELKLKYESIHSIVMHPSDTTLEVILILKCPPLLYKKPLFDKPILNKTTGFCREKTFHMRNIPGNNNHFQLYPHIFGRCNVLSLKLPLTDGKRNGYYKPKCPWDIMSKMKKFTDFKTCIPFYIANVSITQINTSGDILPVLPKFLLANYDLYYAFTCCTSLNHQLIADLTLSRKSVDGNQRSDWNSFWSLVEEKFKESPESVERSFYEIFHSLRRNSFIRILKDFAKIFGLKQGDAKKADHPGICKIRRAVLTPTRMIFMPPHPSVKSRLFNLCNPDFILRVQIRDDNGLLLPFTLGSGASEQMQLALLRSYIKDLILDGVRVEPKLTEMSRVYKFLATTSSQLREHGLVLYAKDSLNRQAKDLRDMVGNFSEIKCVGKYIARVGQTLSQMLSFITIDEAVVTKKDVKRGRHPRSGNPYNFTDGIGKVSKKRARQMADSIGLGPEDEVPSAFQIRYKGFKGMVVVDPYLLPDKDFVFRESMRKFESETKSLEIIKISESRPVYLNRHLINLLDQLGTDFKVFEKLLNDSLKPVAQSLLNETAARETLLKYCSFLYSLLDMKSVSAAGISVLSDPFLRKVLETVLRKNLRELKEKARIPIPFDSGRMMFGVVDEYGVLEYGQVFVQYTNEETGTKVVKGDVMVTRNPCMHPGDIRMLRAVDNDKVRQKLGHIKDCIVFPQKGHRPHPNEMGGGDLDGDEYAVIWMKDLFITKNVQPMDFSDGLEVKLKPNVNQIEDDHVLDFICEFIQSDSVGLIANAWLAASDIKSQGIHDPFCLELCEKYSTALDFAKTGKNCSLSPEEEIYRYPHYFEKGAEKYSYISSRALGKIFDRVGLFELALSDSLHEQQDSSQNWKLNPNFIHPDWKKYEEVALTDYSYYESRITSLMKEVGVDSEVSLLSTILEKNDRFFSGKKDTTDLQELLMRLVKDEFDAFRRRFQKLGDDYDMPFDERLKKASAYYVISYRKNKQLSAPELQNTQIKLLGFHWISSQELSQLVHFNHDFKTFDTDVEEIESCNTNRLTIAIDEHLCTQRIPRYSSENILLDLLSYIGVKDMVIEEIFCRWIRKHPIHSLRLKIDNEALVTKMKTFVADAYSLLKEKEEKITVGSVTIKSLQLLIDSWIQMEKSEASTTLHQLGLAAITTYNRMMQTTSIYALVGSSGNEVEMNETSKLPGDQNSMKHYHISLVWSQRFDDMVSEIGYTHVLHYLKAQSQVKDIVGFVHFKGSYRYWMVTAIGNKWQLDFLNNIVIQKNFFKTTVKAINKRLEDEGHPTF